MILSNYIATTLIFIFNVFTGTQQIIIAVFLAVSPTLITILALTVILGVIVCRRRRNSIGKPNISTSDHTANELDTIAEHASVPIDSKIALQNEVYTCT